MRGAIPDVEKLPEPQAQPSGLEAQVTMVEPGDVTQTRDAGLGFWYRLAAEAVTLAYIAIIAETAFVTGMFFVMFPELGALSHDVFTRPRGTWASAPVLLAITPVLTGIIGIFFTRILPYGYLSVLLTVGGAVAVMLALDSPVAPSISAGLLPLVLGIKSWWYPPGIMLGTVLLTFLSIAWKKFIFPRVPLAVPSREDVIDDVIELTPGGYYWLIALMLFVAVGVFFVNLTGLRFVLFPPLVVIGFEMFGHTAICPWAKRPLLLPVACFLTAAGGFLFWRLLGGGPLTAACAIAWGIVVLRSLDLHVPPALAVALLPLVIDSPTIAYPLSVGLGTLLITLWFLLYRSLLHRLPAKA
jgi:hypothetical protein